MVTTKERESDRFATFILEMYKNHAGLTGWETLQLFLKHEVIEYLKQFYEVISGEPMESIFSDIDEFIAAHKKDLNQI